MRHSPISGEIARSAPPDAHDAQLSTVPSAPPSESEKSAHSTISTAHISQHTTALELRVESQARGKGAFTVGVVAVEVGTYPGGSGYAVGLTRR